MTGEVISVRFDPELAQDLRQLADELGLTISGYLRHVASQAAILSRPGARRWTADNGADITLWVNVSARAS
jgi:hypothetical protein